MEPVGGTMRRLRSTLAWMAWTRDRASEGVVAAHERADGAAGWADACVLLKSGGACEVRFRSYAQAPKAVHAVGVTLAVDRLLALLVTAKAAAGDVEPVRGPGPGTVLVAPVGVNVPVAELLGILSDLWDGGVQAMVCWPRAR